MIKVSRLQRFSDQDFIALFSGKSYEDAVNSAREWAQHTGNRLISYYEQVAIGKSKSILVSYRYDETPNQ